MLKQMHSSSQGFTVYTNDNTTVGLHFPWQLNKVNLTDGVHIVHMSCISVLYHNTFSMMRTMAWRSGLLGLLFKKEAISICCLIVMQSQMTNPHMKNCLDWLDTCQEKKHVFFVHYHWNIRLTNYSLIVYSNYTRIFHCAYSFFLF